MLKGYHLLFPVLLLLFSLTLAGQTPASYTIQTTAGSGAVGDGGVASSAILSQPQGLAIDPRGTLYIADADDCRVRRVSSSGIIDTVAGTGSAGFNGESGSGVLTQLSHPYGLALDSSGNLYIADLGNARVRKLTPDGRIATIAGGGQNPPGAAGLLASQTKLIAPRNLAVDPSGVVYISDFGAHQVLRVDPSGILSVVAGTGIAGLSGETGSAKTAQLSSPAGLAVDTAALYIADSGNNLVRKVVNGAISTVKAVAAPTALALSQTGALYIAGASYFGTTAKAVGSGIVAQDIAVDASGNIYFSTQGVVRMLGVDSSLIVKAGTGASRYYGGDGGPPLAARFHTPSGAVFDDLGNLFIADTENQRIRKVSAAGVVTTFAGTGQAGSGDGQGVATMAQLNSPAGIAIDSLRNLYVADTLNNRILKIGPDGYLTVALGALNGPRAVAADTDGSVFIADTGNNRIVRLSPSGAPTLVTEVLKPAGLAFDSSRALYISESIRVSKLSAAGKLSIVADSLRNPSGLAALPSGDLIVAETGLHRLQLLSASGTMTVLAGTGNAGFTGDGGPAASAQLSAPAGVTVDAQGRIWVADAGNQRIRTLSPAAAPSATPGVVTPSAQPSISIVNAASLVSGTIAPEEIVTIYGSGFDPNQTQVLINGKAATLFYVGAAQINALTPSNLIAGSTAAFSILVKGTELASATLSVAAANLGIFQSTPGQAAALNESGTVNSPSDPAARGSIAVLYATGWNSTVTDPVSLAIGGYPADILYAGPAPGFPGLKQINARVPGGFLSPGRQPLVLKVGTATSPGGVSLSVK